MDNLTDEKAELDIKRDNLYKFVNSSEFDELSEDTKRLVLNKQEIMFSYSICLSELILELEVTN